VVETLRRKDDGGHGSAVVARAFLHSPPGDAAVEIPLHILNWMFANLLSNASLKR